MPFETIGELSPTIKKKYPSEKQQRAFVGAFNASFEKESDESKAMQAGHAAAKRANKDIDEQVADDLKGLLDDMQEPYLDDMEQACERCQDTKDLGNLSGMLLCNDCQSQVVVSVVKRFDKALKAHYTPKEIASKSIWTNLFKRDRKQHDVGFKMLPGRYWLAWYTNNVKDLEAERFDLDGIKADIKFQNSTGFMPELWFWHLPGTKHGEAIHTSVIDNMAIAIGKFDDTPFADKMIAYYEKSDNRVSHGFLFSDKDLRDGVYHRYHTFEISPLPKGKEANPHTSFLAITGESDMNTKARQDAVAHLAEILEDEEKAQELVSNAPLAGGSLKSIISYKAEADKADDKPKDEDEDEDDDDKKKKKPEDMFKSLAEVITANTEAMQEQVKAITSLHDRLVVLETKDKAHKPATPTQPSSIQSLMRDMQENAGKDKDDSVLDMVRSFTSGGNS